MELADEEADVLASEFFASTSSSTRADTWFAKAMGASLRFWRGRHVAARETQDSFSTSPPPRPLRLLVL